MTFDILSLHGTHYQDKMDSVFLKSEQGEMIILKDHTPIVLHIMEGYLELRQSDLTQVVYVKDATLELHDNALSVVSYEAQLAPSLEEAKTILEDRVKERTTLAKTENIDFSKLERDLFEYVKKAKAGKA